MAGNRLFLARRANARLTAAAGGACVATPTFRARRATSATRPGDRCSIDSGPTNGHPSKSLTAGLSCLLASRESRQGSLGEAMPGTGKSYLVDTFAVIATGRICPVITAFKSVEETEKRLHAIVLSGIPMISLDNCTHDLGGEFLCQMAERPIVKIRILGRSETPDCEVRTAAYATGNHVTFKGDMVRRGLVCNLETLAEPPALRRL